MFQRRVISRAVQQTNRRNIILKQYKCNKDRPQSRLQLTVLIVEYEVPVPNMFLCDEYLVGYTQKRKWLLTQRRRIHILSLLNSKLLHISSKLSVSSITKINFKGFNDNVQHSESPGFWD
jgi:hypothetical protein